jgi:hypothetical protein
VREEIRRHAYVDAGQIKIGALNREDACKYVAAELPCLAKMTGALLEIVCSDLTEPPGDSSVWMMIKIAACNDKTQLHQRGWVYTCIEISRHFKTTIEVRRLKQIN